MHPGTSGVIFAAGLSCLLLVADKPVQPVPIPRYFQLPPVPLGPVLPPGVLPPGTVPPAPGVFQWWEPPELPYAVHRQQGTAADEMLLQRERFQELRRRFDIERRLSGDTGPFRGMVIPVTPPPAVHGTAQP